MAYTAAQLNAESFWWWRCSVRYSQSPSSSTAWDLGPRQYLFRDNWALSEFDHAATFFYDSLNVNS